MALPTNWALLGNWFLFSLGILAFLVLALSAYLLWREKNGKI